MQIRDFQEFATSPSYQMLESKIHAYLKTEICINLIAKHSFESRVFAPTNLTLLLGIIFLARYFTSDRLGFMQAPTFWPYL